MGIFKDNAPAYWAAGLPVIPLAPREKKPIPIGWTDFAHKMPPPMLQQSWLGSAPDGNVGLVLGEESGLMMIDIDTPDVRVIEALRKRLPKTPWERVGAKGAVWAYRYNGLKSFRIRAEGHGTMVELLSDRLQVVLPPSIHPTTQKPYTENVPLLDVLGIIPDLPKDVEDIIRKVLEDLGYDLSSRGPQAMSNFVSMGARDTQMVSHAGLLATDVLRGTTTLVEALDRMSFWCNTYAEKVEGDPLDANKGQEKVIQFLIKDVLYKGQGRTLPEGWDDGITEEQRESWGLAVFTADHEQWTYDRIQTYLSAKFALSQGSDSSHSTLGIKYALTRLAESSCISDLDEDRMLNWIYTASGVGVSLMGLKKELKALRQGQIQGLDHTELAHAVLKDMSEFGEIRYHNAFFWQWRGSHWGVLEDSDILKVISDTYGQQPAARKANDHIGILKVMRPLCARDIGVGVVNGINFANGFLTEDMNLGKHSPEMGCTYTLPYRHTPDDTRCPMFQQLLHDCWGQDEDYDEKVRALRIAICATLFQRGPDYQRAVLLLGIPGSGKTQILNIMMGLVPEEGTTTVPPTDWADKFMPAQLYGKIINFAGELSEDKVIRGDTFKLVVEGSLISGQMKGLQIFQFRPTCMNWFGSNYLPKTRDTSNGFNRRWLILGFNHKVAEKDQIVDLAGKILAAEREAIVSWAIQSVDDMKEIGGLYLPPSHERYVDEMANENNTVRHFLKTGTGIMFSDVDIQGKGGKMLSNITSYVEIFNQYHAFCTGVLGVRPVPMKRFTTMMDALGHELGFHKEYIPSVGVDGLSSPIGYRGIILL